MNIDQQYRLDMEISIAKEQIVWEPCNDDFDFEAKQEGYYLSVTHYKDGWLPVTMTMPNPNNTYDWDHVFDPNFKIRYATIDEAKNESIKTMCKHKLGIKE